MDVTPTDRNEATRLHILVSYAYWNTRRSLQFLEEIPSEWNVMLDSGAFTNFTQGKPATPVGEYIEFCQQHEGRFWRIINLDRIGDGATSENNLQAMRDAGVPAIPVFQRGEPLEALERMREVASPVCIGGISQNVGSGAEQAYLRQVLTRVRDLGLDVHLLGVGGEALFKLPCWSGDNSSWGMPNRFGIVQLWGRGRIVALKRSKVRPTQQHTRLLASYDLTWADLADRRKWSVGGWSSGQRDSAVYIAGARSYIRLALALSRLNRRYVFALDPGHLGVLRAAWELEKDSWPSG